MTAKGVYENDSGLPYEIVSRVSSTNIAYRLIRAPNGSAKAWVVFCPGISLNGDLWVGWYANLVSDFNLLVFDVPGYGRSPITPAALAKRRVEDWSGYILSLMDEVGIPVAYLVGEQTGGAASLYTVIRHPERVRACTVISTPLQGKAFAHFRREYTDRSRESTVTAWSDYALDVLFSGDSTELREQFRATHLRNSLEVLLHDGASWDAVDLVDDLRHITTPVQILAPGRSPIVPREYSFECEKIIPGATLVLFGARGQLLAFTEAECASLVTRAFFRRHRLGEDRRSPELATEAGRK